MATLAWTLLMRPVGALIFGLLTDRYGRRIPLIANVIFFSVIELLCGFAPNYSSSCCCASSTASAWAASGAWARRW